MNLRSTFWYFACLLSLLFGFGLIVSKSRTRVDDVFLLPSLKVAKDVVWDALVLERRGADGAIETFRFAQNGDSWYLQGGDQSLKVVADAVKRQLLAPMQNLQHDSFIATSSDLAEHGLDKPRVTVTLKGRPNVGGKTGAEREWKMHLGKDSVDGRSVFVSTSERPDRAYAVAKRELDGYFLKSINDLRSKRLFDFGLQQEQSVQAITLAQGEKEVQLRRAENGPWTFEKPPLGLADSEGTASVGGVKGLLFDIVHLVVESEADFLPADPANVKKFDLSENAAFLRIQTATKIQEGKIDVETLLVGKAEGDHYFARMAGDDGVFKLRRKLLEPILSVLARPGELRSRVILPAEVAKARRIVMSRGKEEAVLRFDDKAWHLTMPGKSETPANAAVVKQLLASLDPRPEIERFLDDPKSTDASLGLDNPREVLAFFEDAKPGKDKAIAIAALAFGKEEKGSVYCRRLLQSGDVSRFAIPKAAAERILANTFVPLMDPALPPLDIDRILRIDADIAGRKLEFQRKDNNWQMITPTEATPQPADNQVVTRDLADRFGHLVVRRWLKSVDAKDDLALFGLANPEIVIRFTVKKAEDKDKKDEAKDATDSVEIKLSKEMERTGEGQIVYGFDSRRPGLVFVAPLDLVKPLRLAMFEDRHLVTRTYPRAIAALFGLPGTPYPWVSPLITGNVTGVALERVKELKITVRGKFETRQLAFARQDKTWIDKSGLQGFQLDPARVDEAVSIATHPKLFAVVGMEGPARRLYKLKPEEAVLLLQATLDDGKTLTLTVGATFGQVRFAVSSNWPDAILAIPAETVDPLLQGPAFFSRPAAQ